MSRKVLILVGCLVALALAHAQSSASFGSGSSLSASVAAASSNPTSSSLSDSGSVVPITSASSLSASMPSSSDSSNFGSLGSPSSASSSGSSDDPTESDVEDNSRSMRKVNKKGGRVTIVTNKNTLTHIETKKASKSAAEIEADERRTTNEERNKKEEEERKEKAKRDELEERAARKRREEEEREAAKKKREDEERERKEAAERKERQEAAERKEREERERQQQAAERQRQEREKAEREERERREREQQQRERERREREEREAAERRKREQEEAERRRNSLQKVNGWNDYGHSYLGASVDRYENLCFVSGLLSGWGGQVGVLGENCRPADGRLIFTLHKGDHPARVDVLPDGRIFHIVAGGGHWMSLDGMWFTVNRRHYMHIHNWHPYGGEYRAPTQDNTAGLISASGLIRHGSWGHLAQLNWGSAHGRRIFSCNNHETVTRCDVTGPYIVYSGGSHNHAWVSLDGIMFTNNIAQWLPLYNGWHNYGHGYVGAHWGRVGTVCSLGGLINGHWAGHITNLPDQCRPRGRIIFGGNVHIRNARIDVLPDGSVHYINGRSHWSWLSLEGIKFIAR